MGKLSDSRIDLYTTTPIDPNTGLQKGKLSSSRLSTKSTYDLVMSGYQPLINTGEVTGPLSRYDGAVSREDVISELIPGGYSLTKERGMQQPGIAQVGAMLNQAIVGRFVGGTIEAVGDLLDLEQYKDLATGNEKDFGNWLVDIGKGIGTWAEETTPIYNTYDEGEFAPGHWSWWMTNATSLGSTLSLLVPSTGVVKLLGWAGKGLKLLNNLKKLEQAGKISAKTSKALKYISEGASQAVVSRHLESLMEARDVYESSYQELIQKGVPEEDARKGAAEGASSVYKRNWVMLLQDIPQYIFLNKILSGSFDESIQAMKAIGRSTGAITAKKIGAITTDLSPEAFEEAYQYVVGEEGRYLAERTAFGKDFKDTEFKDRLNDYIQSGDLWTSAFWGAAGAGVYQSAGHIFKNKLNGKLDPQLENLKGWSSEFAFWAAKATEAKVKDDTVGFDTAISGLITTLGTKAAAVGNKDNLKEFLKQLRNETVKDDLGIDKEHISLFKNNLVDIEESIDRIDELYKKNYSDTQDHKLSHLLTSQEFLVERFDKIENKILSNKDKFKSEVVDFEKLSPTFQRITELTSKSATLNAMLNIAKTRSETTDKEKTRELDKSINNNSIKRLSIALDEVNKEIETLQNNYSKEERDNDAKVKVDFKSKTWEDFLDTLINLEKIKEEKEVAKDTIDFVRKNKNTYTKKEQEEIQKEKNIEKAITPEVNVLPNAEPTIDTGDVVTYTDKETGVSGEYTVTKVNEDNTAELTPISKPVEKDIDDFTNKIIAGEQISSTEDLQFYEDNKETIKQTLKQKQIVQKPVVTIYSELELKKKNTTEETDNISEEVTDEGNNLSTIYQKERERSFKALTSPSTMLAWWGINKESKVSESKAIDGETSFDEIVSNSKVDLSQAELEFEIDNNTYTSGQKGFWQRTTTGKSGKIYKHEDLDGSTELTQDEINDVLSTDGDPKLSNDFVDFVGIKVRVKVGGNTFEDGVYLHLTSYDFISVPLDIIDKAEETNNPDLITEYKRKQMINTRVFRRNILRHLLAGNSVKMIGLDRTTGHFNNQKDKDGKPLQNNVAKVIGKQSNKIRVGVSTKNLNRKIWISDTETMGNASSNGNVFVETDKTANGKTVPMKCNVSKLSEEHAEILWEAFIQRIKEGSNALMKHPKVEGLTVREVISLLAHSGNNTMINDPETGQPRQMPPHLINKQLFIGRDKSNNGRVTVYAGINKFELFPFESDDKTNKSGWKISEQKQQENKKKFIEWATQHKNYAIHKKIIPSTTNPFGFHVELNKPLQKEFKLGSWENKPSAKGIFKTYGAFLIDNNVITTDVVPFGKHKSVTHFPGVRIMSNPNLSDSIIVKAVKSKTVKKEPITQQPTKSAVNAVVKTDNKLDVTSKESLRSVVPGAIVYSVSNAVNTDTGSESTDVSVVFKVDANGVIKLSHGVDKKTENAADGHKYTDLTALDAIYENLLKLPIEYTGLKVFIDFSNAPSAIIKASDEAKETQQVPGDTVPTSTGSVKLANDILDELGDSFNPDLEAPFMEYNEEDVVNYEKANIKDEIKWLRNKLGNIPVEIQDQIIVSVLTGKKAFGQFKGNSILLYDGAAKGVLYHEAFHRVSLILLTRSQRDVIYNEAKVKYKSLLESKYGKREWTRFEVEEILAEEFRKFVIEKEYNTTFIDKIKNIFKTLYNTIKNLFIKGNNVVTINDIDSLFKGIQSGYFKGKPVRSQSLSDFYLDAHEYLYEIHGVDFPSVEDPNHFFSIVKGLASTMFTVNKVNEIKDLVNLDWETLKTKLAERESTFLKAAVEKYQNKPEAKEQVLYWARLHREILDNFHIYKEEVRRYLATAINIKYTGDDDFNEDLSKSIQAYSMNAFEYDAKDNALAAVKFVLSFIPKSDKRNPATGMWEFMDFNILWGRLMHDLHDAESIDVMMERIKNIATSEVNGEMGFAFSQLYGKLQRLSPQFRTQFENSIKNHRHQFLNLLVKSIYSTVSVSDILSPGAKIFSGQAYGFTDAHIMKAQDNILNRWADLWYASDMFSRKEGKAQELKKNIVDDVNSKYNKLLDTVRQQIKQGRQINSKNILERLTKLLNNVEIPITENDLETYLQYYIPENITVPEEKLLHIIEASSYVLSNQGIFSTIISDIEWQKISSSVVSEDNASLVIEGTYSPDEKALKRKFTNQSFIRNLAKAHLLNNNENQLNTVFGPDGNAYYIYSKLNYMTNLVRDIANNSEYFQQIKNGVNNQNSYLLQQLESENVRKNFNVVTFSAFIDKTGYDRGRSYSDISDLEEFMLKLCMLNARFLSGETGTDIIIVPVLGDRPTYFALKGLQKIPVRYIKNEKDEYVLDPSIIKIFSGYVKDEERRIKQVKEDIRIAQETNNYTNLILNYHYTEDKKTGRKIFNGNGLKFNIFKTFNLDKYSKATDIEKENIIKEALELHIEEILKTAVDLGVVTKNDKNEYSKGLLPSFSINESTEKDKTKPKGLVEAVRSNYNDDETMAVKHILADYAINTIMAGIEFDKIFIGDNAFYSSSEDKVKRYQALTSTGDIMKASSEESEFSSQTYNVLTAKTIKLKSQYKEALYNHIKSLLNEQYPDKTQDEIKNIINNIVDSYGYNKIDPTDGQSYISAEMFKQILGREGLWTDDKAKAFEILNSDRTDITPEEELQAAALIMPVLKMMHFGFRPITNSDGSITNVPIYDKTAMFPLFRRLVKGTYMETIYNRMEGIGEFEGSIPVHMIKYDSAVKTGRSETVELFTLDENGNINGSNIEGLKSYVPIEQRYNHLLHQLNTDPHDVEDFPLGTQVKKVGLLNIQQDKLDYELDGKKITGKDVFDKITSSISILSEKGKVKLLRRLGSANGDLSHTQLKDIIETLREEATRAALPYNVISSLRYDLNGLYLSIDSIADRKWIYNRIITLINRYTIDIHLPGNQLIQAANFGMVGRQSKDLSFLYEKDGKTIRGIEARVGISFFKNYIPSNITSYEDKKAWLIKNKEVLQGMGYRIPTQGQNQIIPIHFVDFLPEASGDIIILPNEFTTLTGSDFDIDKLYTVRYNLRYDEDMNLEKVPFLDESKDLQKRYDTYVMDVFFHADKYFSKRFIKGFLKVKDEYYLTLKEHKLLKESPYYDEIKKLYDVFKDLKDNGDSKEEVSKIMSKIDSIIDKAFDLIESKHIISKKYKTFKNEIITSLLNEKLIPTIEEFSHWPIEKQNTVKALQNRLIDLYMSVLKSPSHFVEGYSPLGSLKDSLKDLAVEIDTAEKNNKDITLSERKKELLMSMGDYTVEYNLDVKYRNLGGKGGVGPFALANVHHAFAQQVNLKFSEANIGLGNEDENGNTDLSKIEGTDGIRISEWISAMIDAHVDIVKDPYVISLNVVKDTYSFVSLLLRAGAGLNTFYITSQPILKHYVKLKRQSRGKLGKQTFDIVSSLREEYMEIANSKLEKGETIDKLNEKLDFNIWDTQQLLNDIKTPKTKRDSSWYLRQLTVLDYFVRTDKLAGKLNALVLASQIDTKKFGTNPGLVQVFKNKLARALEDTTFVNTDKLIPYDPKTDTVINVEGGTFLGALLENSVLLSEKLFDKLSITSTQAYKTALREMLYLTGNRYTVGEDGERIANVIFDELYALIASRFFIDDVNGLGLSQEKVKEIINDLPKKIQRIQTGKLFPELQNNQFIKMFIPETDEQAELKTFAKSPSVKRNKWEKETITAEWETMLSNKNPDIRKLAVEFFIYSFYTTGFKTTAFGFQTFAPNKLYKQISDYVDGRTPSFDSFIRTTFDYFNTPEGTSYLLTKLDEIFRNNFHIDQHGKSKTDLSLVPEVNFINNEIEFKSDKGVTHPAIFSVTNKKISKNLYVGKNYLEQPIFKPFVKYKSILSDSPMLYEYIGYVTEQDEKDETLFYYHPVYAATQALGYYDKGKAIKEYGFKKSLIPSNNYLTINNTEQLIKSIKIDSTNKQPREEYKTFKRVDQNDRFISSILTTEESEPENSLPQEQLTTTTQEKQEVIQEDLLKHSEDKINVVLSKQNEVTGRDNSNYYINGLDYIRVSRYTGEEVVGEGEALIASATLGTVIDGGIMRKVLSGLPVNYTDVVQVQIDKEFKPVKISQFLTKDHFEKTVKIFENIKNHFESTGEKIYANNVVVFGEINNTRVAGELDILTIDKKGKFHLYDLKTMTNKSYNNRLKGFKNQKSKVQKGSDQLNTYRTLLKGAFNIELTDMHLIPLALTYTVRKNVPELYGSSLAEVTGLDIKPWIKLKEEEFINDKVNNLSEEERKSLEDHLKNCK